MAVHLPVILSAIDMLLTVLWIFSLVSNRCQISHNGQGLLQGWNSLIVRPEPLLIKDIKVQVNKQKPNSVRPAQMKHNSDKMTIAPMSSQPCSKPNVVRIPFLRSRL
jgi:hypothetical protein